MTFDNTTIGKHAKTISVYKHINSDAVPIEMQVNFCVDCKSSCQGTRKQFPLTLSWAVTIHNCQGLTINETVVDITPAKGHYRADQAYVAFSRVWELKYLHIVNYAWAQIHVSQTVASEMDRLRTNPVPCIPLHVFPIKSGTLNILHFKHCWATCKNNWFTRGSTI